MTRRFIWVLLVLALAPPAFADAVSVQWNNPTACTAGSGAYTHLGVNILVNGAFVSLAQGTSYAATLNSGDVVTASACGYCGAPPANGGAWSAHGRCAVGNESAVSNPVTYTSTGTTTPPPVNNGSAPTSLTITLGVAGTAPPAQELDTFTTIGSSWSAINTIAALTVSNGNVQCGTPDVDCGMIRNTTWPANQSSTVTVGAIATNDEVGAFVRATTTRMGYMCNQMQGGNAVIFEMNGTGSLESTRIDPRHAARRRGYAFVLRSRQPDHVKGERSDAAPGNE